MKRFFDIDFTEGQVQLIINKLCDHFEIPQMHILPMTTRAAKSDNCVAIYYDNVKGYGPSALMLDESDMITALHELGHHLQYFIYEDCRNDVSAHSSTYTLAISKITTACKKLFGKDRYPYKAGVLRRCGHNNTKCDKVYKKIHNIC